MAATGKQLKQSVKVFHSFMLYLRLPAKEKRCELGLVVKATRQTPFPVYEDRLLTLVIKAVDSINGGAFVVSTQQEKILGIFDFVG